MKIGLDVSLLCQENLTGVGQFTLRSVSACLTYLSHDQFILFGLVPRKSRGLIESRIGALGGLDSLVLKSMPSRWFAQACRWWQKKQFPEIEWMIGKIDVFHSYDWFHFPSRAVSSSVVYDLTPMSHPQFHSIENRAVFDGRIRAFEDKKSWLFCISHHTQKMLEATYPSLAGQSSVIYPAYDYSEKMIKPDNAAFNQLKQPFFLLVNPKGERKNAIEVFEAYQRVPELNHYGLVVVGQIDQGLKKKFLALGVKLIELGFVSEAELNWCYVQAISLIYPSLVEGFGYPIVEAMAAGTLVITSKKSGTEEAGGKAAFFVEPDKPIELARTMKMVAGLFSKQRLIRISQGKRQAGLFSGKQHAVALRQAWITMVKDGRK